MATAGWEPCATTPPPAALGLRRRQLLPMSGADPQAPSPAPHPQGAAREGPSVAGAGSWCQPELGRSLGGWGQTSSPSPWAELGFFPVPLGRTGILLCLPGLNWDPSPSLQAELASFSICLG